MCNHCNDWTKLVTSFSLYVYNIYTSIAHYFFRMIHSRQLAAEVTRIRTAALAASTRTITTSNTLHRTANERTSNATGCRTHSHRTFYNTFVHIG